MKDEKQVRMQVRLDPKLHREVERLAEKVGTSLNKFMETLLEWVVESQHLGRPEFDDETHEYVGTKDVPGVVWFGTDPEVAEEVDEDGRHEWVTPPHVAVVLEFTRTAKYPPRKTPSSSEGTNKQT